MTGSGFIGLAMEITLGLLRAAGRPNPASRRLA